MKIGVLVNTDENLKAFKVIVNEAVSRGHTIEVFVMDEGVRLLENDEFTTIGLIEGSRMVYCNYNVMSLGIDKGRIPEGIIDGSQYDNAKMMNSSDKVIVL